MSKIKILCLLGCMFYAVIITSQSTFDKNNLLGKWNSYKVTTVDGGDGSDLTFDEKPFNKKMMMNFISSKEMLFSINNSEEYKIKYLVKDGKIIIQHREYIIEALTKTSLTLKEEGILGILIYMKKEDSR